MLIGIGVRSARSKRDKYFRARDRECDPIILVMCLIYIVLPLHWRPYRVAAAIWSPHVCPCLALALSLRLASYENLNGSGRTGESDRNSP